MSPSYFAIFGERMPNPQVFQWNADPFAIRHFSPKLIYSLFTIRDLSFTMLPNIAGTVLCERLSQQLD